MWAFDEKEKMIRDILDYVTKRVYETKADPWWFDRNTGSYWCLTVSLQADVITRRVQDKMREFNIDEYFYVSWSREDDTTGMLCICINNKWLDKLKDLYTLIKLRLK